MNIESIFHINTQKQLGLGIDLCQMHIMQLLFRPFTFSIKYLVKHWDQVLAKMVDP